MDLCVVSTTSTGNYAILLWKPEKLSIGFMLPKSETKDSKLQVFYSVSVHQMLLTIGAKTLTYSTTTMNNKNWDHASWSTDRSESNLSNTPTTEVLSTKRT
jgi:hypothetical protein